jgi:hypothetical protein
MVLIIITAGHRGAACVGRLLAQVRDAGWSGPRFVVCDGPPVRASGFATLASNRRQGQRRTYWRALALGVEESRRDGDDRILILEDDVELCRNALEYIERTAVPAGLDFITWFDGHMLRAGAGAGIYSVPAEKFFCLQGVTWRRATAEALLRSPEAATWSDRHSGDTLIARILRGRRYGVHVPNLLQHIGAQSICNPGQKLAGVRTANNYPGRRFDASALDRGRPALAQRPLTRAPGPGNFGLGRPAREFPPPAAPRAAWRRPWPRPGEGRYSSWDRR